MLSFFPGEKECAFFSDEIPDDGAGLIPLSCDKIKGSITSLVTLHYICEEPDSLTVGFTDKDKVCPYREPWSLGKELRDLFFDTGLATAALIGDKSILEQEPWAEVALERGSQLDQIFAKASSAPHEELFDNYRRARRFAQAAAIQQLLQPPTHKQPMSVRFVVGNGFNSRVTEAGQLFGTLASNEVANNLVDWEVQLSQPFRFAEQACLAGGENVTVALIDASTFDALMRRGCEGAVFPAARIGREDFYIAMGSRILKEVGVSAPWALRATVGIAGETPDGAASADQMFMSWVQSEYDPQFGREWLLISHETGGLATEALANGSVDITISNPFEVLGNIDVSQALMAEMTRANGVEFNERVLATAGYTVADYGSIPNAANNYYLAVVGGDKNREVSTYVSDIARIVTASPEWQKFLNEHSMIDIDPRVTGIELRGVEEFMRP